MVTDVVQNNNDEDLKITIGKNIAEYRKITGLSQIEFAEKLTFFSQIMGNGFKTVYMLSRT